jgi:hypothetical protein
MYAAVHTVWATTSIAASQDMQFGWWFEQHTTDVVSTVREHVCALIHISGVGTAPLVVT